MVHGAGRVAELADLGLEAAGVEWGEHGIQVADHLQSTTNSAVWAAGGLGRHRGHAADPIAVSEAKVVASNMIKGTTTTPDGTVALSRRGRSAQQIFLPAASR